MSGRKWPYYTAQWRQLRKSILKRDNWRCRACGEVGFEVDHRIPWRQGGAVWDEDNLQVMCRSCHMQKTKVEYGRLPGPDRREWREEVRRMEARSAERMREYQP